MKKRLTSIALTLALVCALALPASAAGKFSDVASDAYYAEAVNWAVEKGITSGTSATTFSPNSTCTVAQILAFLYRANGSPQVSISNPFVDVSPSDYYYNAALWAYQKGLVSGSVFGPNAPCTRSMVVTYLWKLEGSPSVSVSGYAPYTISGKAYYYCEDWNRTYGDLSITFSAASVEEKEIQYVSGGGNDLWMDMNGGKNLETRKVTMITLKPGSMVNISNGALEIEGSHGSLEQDFKPELLYSATDVGVFRGGVAEAIFMYEGDWISPFKDENGNMYVVTLGSYAPLALSGKYGFSHNWYDHRVYDEAIYDYSMDFSAAVVKNASVKLYGDKYLWSEEAQEPVIYRDKQGIVMDVTLIAVAPGNKVDVHSGYRGEYDHAENDCLESDNYYLDRNGQLHTITISDMGSSQGYFGDVDFMSEYEADFIRGCNDGGYRVFDFDNRFAGSLVDLGEGLPKYLIMYGDTAAAAGLLNDEVGGVGFSDVPTSAPYAQAVAWAVDKGITSGTSKTTFSPDGVCTRGQIVTFLYRAFGK